MYLFKQIRIGIVFLVVFASQTIIAQCNGNWEEILFESFEYGTDIPGVVPGSIYHTTPQSHAPGIRTGAKHMYLNFVNGYTGPAYDRSFDVCMGSTVRFSFWFKDTWGASNNFDVNIYDGGGTLLETRNYNIPNNNSWNQYVSNTIDVTTPQVRLEIVNLLTVGGNDLAIDDLKLEVCSETVLTVDTAICSSSTSKDLKDFLPGVPSGGNWSGASALTNGDLGTFTVNSNLIGTYNYLLGVANPCPSENYEVNIVLEDGPNAGSDANALFCGGGVGSDLFELTGATDQSGGWIGPSVLANGYQGTFDPNADNFGDYQYFIVSTNSCPNDTADISVQLVSIDVELGNDTTLCQGESLTLDAGAGFDYYLWNNNEITQTIDVNTSGNYTVEVGSLGGNLVINGDFEAGDQDFSTDYSVGVGGPWGLLSDPATYAINTSANNVHSNFPPCTDHTSGGGNYMIVNGASTLNTSTWCQSINVQPNTDYQFSTWVNTVSNDPEAILQFSINGVALGGLFNAPSSTCDWQQFFSLWNSGANTSVTICILNQSIQQGGNDYGLDDISFRPICKDEDDINVSIQALPIVDLGGNQSICETSQVILDAENAGLDFLWQDNSTNQTFTTNTSGTYSVTVTDGFDCSASDQMTLSVEIIPNAGTDNSELICESSTSMYMNSMIDAGGSFGSWEIMSGSPDFNAMTGIVQFSGAQSFQIANIVNGIECTNDTAFFDVQVEAQPDAGANNNLKLCNDSILDLSSLLQAGVSGGTWSELTNSNQFTAGSGTFNTNGLDDGLYSFEYEIQANAPCVNSTVSITIDVVEIPDPLFSIDEPIGCVDHTVQFSDLSGGSGSFECNWNFGDNTNSSSCGSISHTYTSPGMYDVTYSMTNDNLCYDEFTIVNAVEVVPNPNAFFTFGPNTIFSSEPEVTFSNGSSFADSYTWSFGDGSTTSFDEHPIHTYPDLVAGIYSVELEAQNNLGCTDIYSLEVIVVDEIVFYHPNAFTPDGDNYNQVFKPVMTSGFQVDTYNMEVYDRWGELVFTSNDINTGWDGKYKGKLCQDGTYVWKIYFKEQFNDKKHEHLGHVTMIR